MTGQEFTGWMAREEKNKKERTQKEEALSEARQFSFIASVSKYGA